VYGDHTAATIYKGLKMVQLLIGEIGKVEKLDHKIRAVKLVLGWKEICLFNRNARNALKHGNKHLLNTNIVMLAPSMILWSEKPQDVDVPAQPCTLPSSSEFQDLSLGYGFVRPRISFFSTIGSE
tara:strand:+ start:3799 stop:4173 length:375 start_codon:yes stop_codon:yes gene_type:complete